MPAGIWADIDEKPALRNGFKEALQLKRLGLTFLQAIALVSGSPDNNYGKRTDRNAVDNIKTGIYIYIVFLSDDWSGQRMEDCDEVR